MAKHVFIAGAPRSGTTYLTNMLGQHPDIVQSKAGASYYFMDKEHPLLDADLNYFKQGLNGFSNVFPTDNATYLLDGTDHLMYQLSMIDIIKELPDIQLIFILREPTSRIFSSFNYTKNNLANFKNDISFSEYVNALLNDDKNKIENWLLSEKRSGYVLSRELNYSTYSFYLMEWRNKIGFNNMKVYLFEDMQLDENLFFEKVLIDLELNKFKFISESKNESIVIKNKSIHQKIMNASNLFPTGKMKDIFKKMYYSVQNEKAIITEKDQEKLLQLKSYFKSENKKLSQLLSLDLSLWD